MLPESRLRRYGCFAQIHDLPGTSNANRTGTRMLQRAIRHLRLTTYPVGYRSSVAAAPITTSQRTQGILDAVIREEITMSNAVLSLDEVRRMAAIIGWDSLSDEQLQELTRAANVAQARRANLPVGGLTPADEPAHVYRLGQGDER
jgi:hypothetical protein